MSTMDKKKRERLDKICGAINKSKSETIQYMGGSQLKIERFPSGHPKLDDALGGGWPIGRFIELYGPESGGKCHAKGTKVIMFDGTFKKVEDIKVGDQLMGPDSKPRNVLDLAHGYEKLYRIKPKKGIGEGFIINENHILSLKNTEIGSKFGEIRNISLLDYLDKSKNYQYYNKLYRVPIEFEEKRQEIDSYFLGLWLGDGSKDSSRIHTKDEEVVGFICDYAKKLGMGVSVVNDENEKCEAYTITNGNGRDKKSFCLHTKLKEADVFKNKHIPHKYKTGSKLQRMQLLAGLIDSDGYRGGTKLVFSNTNKTLSEDVLFLARSLGYFCNIKEYKAKMKRKDGTTYECDAYKVYINGDCTKIPLKIARKKADVRKSNRDSLVTSFDVIPLEVGEFFGFFLDGDHLYLLDSFIVQHNTTTCLHAISEFQKKFPSDVVAMIDTEFSFDPAYARSLGIKTEELLVSQPESAEEAMGILRDLISYGVKLVVVDSIAAMCPQRELDGEIGDSHVATLARVMTSSMKMLTGLAAKSGTTVFWTNQMRDKIGVTYGAKTGTPGGRAIKHHMSVRVKIAKVGVEKDGDEVVSSKTKLSVEKNKTAPPFRVADVSIVYGYGFDLVAGVFDMALQKKVVKKAGGWFAYGEVFKIQGRQKVLEMLRDDEKLFNELEKAVSDVSDEVPELKGVDVEAKVKKLKKKTEDPVVRKPVSEGDNIEVGVDDV